MGNVYETVRNSILAISTTGVMKLAGVSERRVLDVLRALKRRGIVDCVPLRRELLWFPTPEYLARNKPISEQPGQGGGLDG